MLQVEKLEGCYKTELLVLQVKRDKGNESLMFSHSFLPLIVLGSKHKQSINKRRRAIKGNWGSKRVKEGEKRFGADFREYE